MSEINAVTPTGTTTLIHLHKLGYVPATGTSKTPKHRSSVDQRTMCALYVRQDAAAVTIVDALDWPGRRLGPGLPQWRWCGLCVGRALAATDQIGAAVQLLAEKEVGQ